jgi:hypothetical protein
MRISLRHFITVVAVTLCAATYSGAAVIADFNSSEGVFNLQPTFSSQSNVSSASTADRVTTGSFEGGGNEQVVAVMSATNPARIRFLANSGTPAAGTIIGATAGTTTAGVDGFVGFYYKTSSTGLKVAINLDDSTNTGGGMDMGTLKTVVADGQWHLAEWNLDDDAQWDAASGIGGDGTIQNGQHSVDSIYIQNITAGSTIFFDFVTYNPTGSIAALVPEPASMSLLAIGALALFRRKRA